MKTTMKTLLLMFLVCALIFSCAGCGGTTSDTPEDTDNGNTAEPSAPEGNGTSETSDTLTVCIDSEPTHMLPPYANLSKGDQFVQRAMFNMLFEYNEDGELVPSLATGYEWIDDTHMRLHMREGVTAYDGTDLTAHDLIWDLNLALEGTGVNNYTTYLNIENCFAEDDYTVNLEFANAFADVEYVLSQWGIADESSAEANGGVEGVIRNGKCNTGRYNLDEWADGKYVKLVYNENYWDDSYVPSYQYIVITWITDSASRALTVQSGDADVALELGYSDIISVLNNPDIKLLSGQNSKIVAFNFNCTEDSIFNNEDLRAAVWYCIDPTECMQVLYGDYTTTIETCVSSKLSWYAKPDNVVRGIDYDLAKEHLEAAGCPDGFEFTLLVEPTSGFTTVAELVQANLAQVGITMNIEAPDLSSFFASRNAGEFDCFMCNSSRYIVAASAVKGWDGGRYTFAQAMGGTGYSSPELEELIDVVYTRSDSTAALAEIQQYAVDHYLGVGICNSASFGLCTTKVDGFTLNPDGYAYVAYFRPAT